MEEKGAKVSVSQRLSKRMSFPHKDTSYCGAEQVITDHEDNRQEWVMIKTLTFVRLPAFIDTHNVLGTLYQRLLAFCAPLRFGLRGYITVVRWRLAPA
jgi:hypothetical protein